MNTFGLKTSLACALLTFASTAEATRLQTSVVASDSCTPILQGSLRTKDSPARIYEVRPREGFLRTDWYTFFMGDQEWSFCDDGTLRNHQNKCLTWMNLPKDESIGSTECYTNVQQCDAADDNQIFSIQSQSKCTDRVGMEQDCVKFFHPKANNTLGGALGLCGGDGTTQMFRKKGAVIAHGELIFQNADTCLRPVDYEQEAQVTSVECNDDDESLNWTIYENGEIVHDQTGWCLGTRPGEIGIMSVYSCQDRLEQAFTPIAQEDGSFVLQWKQDQTQCATHLLNYQGNSVAPRDCNEGSEDQRINIGSHEWQAPVFNWIEVGCSHGIEMQHAYSEEFNLISNDGVSSTADDGLVDSAKQAMANMISFPNGVPVSSDSVSFLAESFSQMMFHPSDESVDRSHLFQCDAGADTCMYRSVMSMQNASLDASLQWITGYTKCMTATPVCPPLTQYNNGVCEAVQHFDY